MEKSKEFGGHETALPLMQQFDLLTLPFHTFDPPLPPPTPGGRLNGSSHFLQMRELAEFKATQGVTGRPGKAQSQRSDS